jgi:hypothetical protein
LAASPLEVRVYETSGEDLCSSHGLVRPNNSYGCRLAAWVTRVRVVVKVQASAFDLELDVWLSRTKAWGDGRLRQRFWSWIDWSHSNFLWAYMEPGLYVA